jgi:hypothetical protein
MKECYSKVSDAESSLTVVEALTIELVQQCHIRTHLLPPSSIVETTKHKSETKNFVLGAYHIPLWSVYQTPRGRQTIKLREQSNDTIFSLVTVPHLETNFSVSVVPGIEPEITYVEVPIRVVSPQLERPKSATVKVGPLPFDNAVYEPLKRIRHERRQPKRRKIEPKNRKSLYPPPKPKEEFHEAKKKSHSRLKKNNEPKPSKENTNVNDVLQIQEILLEEAKENNTNERECVSVNVQEGNGWSTPASDLLFSAVRFKVAENDPRIRKSTIKPISRTIQPTYQDEETLDTPISEIRYPFEKHLAETREKVWQRDICKEVLQAAKTATSINSSINLASRYHTERQKKERTLSGYIHSIYTHYLHTRK